MVATAGLAHGLLHFKTIISNGVHQSAKNIASKWVTLNAAVYRRMGKLMEKYNAIDIHLEAGGGECTSQDGFDGPMELCLI